MAGRLEHPSGSGAPHVLFSGGGSGGHVYPGLAVATQLRQRGWQVSWAGSEHGLESKLVRDQGVAFHALPARPVVGQAVVGKARAGWTLLKSAWSARDLVRRLGARVVVGTGGYVSAPAAVGARLASRPVLLVEPNAAVGLANRWLSRLAAEGAIAYDETATQLRCPCQTTGVPVRAEFFEVGELPEGATLSLLVVGGSQGARRLNELVPRALARIARRAKAEGPEVSIRVVHQAGAKNLGDAKSAYEASEIPPSAGIEVDVVAFLDDMPSALGKAHLVISRAGAITLAEICAAGRPSLLVPLGIAGGHQIDNARRLAAAGAAEMPGDSEADFHALVDALARDRPRLRSMASAARGLAKRGAAEAIADRVEHLARRAG